MYYKFNSKKREFFKNNKLTSQVDIFPTILDYLFQKNFSYFHGMSLFHENSPFVVSTRFSASRTPNEFFLHDGKNKITLRFNNPNIFQTKELQILSIRDSNDEIYLKNHFKKKSLMNKTKKDLELIFSK
jgi:hypothetical protein